MYYFQKLHAQKGASVATDTPPDKTVQDGWHKICNQKTVIFSKRLATVFLIV
jgi:hypothetical protein